MIGITIRTGTDIVEVARVQRILDRPGARLGKLFTPSELLSIQHHHFPAQAAAARFAAKEAGMKLLGIGWPEVAWTEFEVTSEPTGRPRLHFSGKALEHYWRQGYLTSDLSLSHTENYATATVVGLIIPT